MATLENQRRLLRACDGADVGTVHALLESGNVDVNGADKVRLLSALRQSASGICAEYPRRVGDVVGCAEWATDGCITHQWGRTPLHVASSVGRLPVVELLLQAGADPNADDKVCWSSKSCHAFLTMDMACI
jgi:hypothetical protein